MSKDIKPLVFRTLEGRPVVPSWLRHAAQQVLPASGPFAKPSEDAPEPPAAEPESFPLKPGKRESAPPPPPPRPISRSSLPPRMSAPPPPVVITSQSLAPAPLPRITPAEQEAFAHAALELGSLRARVLAHAEAELLELAVSIAETIIGREIERDPAIHAALARAAVAALGDTRAAKLRVSRAAYRAISALHGEESVEVDGVQVELTLDNSLEGLSVMAESGASRVDGRVSERLAAVLRALEADHRRKDVVDDQ